MLFNTYNRVARLYPALFATVPIICGAISLYPNLSLDLPRGAASAVALSGLAYLLASIARSRGKKIETRLISNWSGWPTTTILCHRDNIIDNITKARYHALLSDLCNTKFPTPAEEQGSPDDADTIYRSATKRLIEARRDPKYQILHYENASYGFRRNMLGLKPIVLTITALVAILIALQWWFVLPEEVTWPVIQESIRTYPYLPALLMIQVVYFIFWATYITPTFVFQSAREYAEALFRTLDTD